MGKPLPSYRRHARIADDEKHVIPTGNIQIWHNFPDEPKENQPVVAPEQRLSGCRTWQMAGCLEDFKIVPPDSPARISPCGKSSHLVEGCYEDLQPTVQPVVLAVSTKLAQPDQDRHQCKFFPGIERPEGHC